VSKSVARVHDRADYDFLGLKKCRLLLVMTELLKFYPQGKHLYIEFLANKYIDVQPTNDFETKMLIERIRPVIQQLDEFVESRGLKEVIEVNLKDVPISKLNSEMALEMIHLCMSLRPDKELIDRIVITNSNPLFSMIYKTVQGRVDPRIRRVLSIESNSNFD